MRTKVLKALKESKNRYLSGEELSQKIGVSRTSVWKHIKKLKDEGYNIESVSSKGYRFVEDVDLLSEAELELAIQNVSLIKEVIYLKSVDSTNTYAKKLSDTFIDGTLVISDEQVEGRGRLGRQWVSPPGTGIWMSMFLVPDIAPHEASIITQIAGAAVTKVLSETLGLDCKIKWPNDITLNGKKVCGILTEMSSELNCVNYIVVGIGINVNMEEFPEEIKSIATSLYIESGEKHKRYKIIESILKEFEVQYTKFVEEKDLTQVINICRGKSALIGNEVRIVRRNKEIIGQAIDISNEGELIVKYENGEIEKIFSGEVSVRGINGYV